MKDHKRASVVQPRLRVQDVQYSLFGRSIHPELYHSYESRRFDRGRYAVQVEILRSGHLVQWTYDDKLTMSEVVTRADGPLPSSRRLESRRFQVKSGFDIEWRRGIRYRVAMQMESVEPELLWSYQKELSPGGCQGLMQTFGTGGRIALGGMSYVHVETRDRTVLVQSVHTFPDDAALLKVESFFQAPQ